VLISLRIHTQSNRRFRRVQCPHPPLKLAIRTPMRTVSSGLLARQARPARTPVQRISLPTWLQT
jgi:hypothetical protein